MSDQRGERKYSHEEIRKQIDDIGTVGGPIVGDIGLLQITCTAGNQEFYDNMLNAIECGCGSEGPTSSLCKAIAAGDILYQEPFSCMVDLIQNYSNCDENIPSEKRQAAYKAFADVTGYKAFDLSKGFSTLEDETKKLLMLNSFYIFMPIFILIIIMIWLMVGFGWFDWAAGLFFTVIAFIVLYGFAVFYRINAHNIINNRSKQLLSDAEAAQANFENSIAYWPQGLFAVACAVTSTGTTGWTCNEVNPCPPCAGTARAPGTCGGARNLEADEEPRPRRRRAPLKRAGRTFD